MTTEPAGRRQLLRLIPYWKRESTCLMYPIPESPNRTVPRQCSLIEAGHTLGSSHMPILSDQNPPSSEGAGPVPFHPDSDQTDCTGEQRVRWQSKVGRYRSFRRATTTPATVTATVAMRQAKRVSMEAKTAGTSAISTLTATPLVTTLRTVAEIASAWRSFRPTSESALTAS